MSASIPSSVLEKFTTFGDLLRFLRRRAGITQMDLSIQVGYSDAQISRLEQNFRLPDIPTIEALFVPALGLENEPKAVARLLDLAAKVRRDDVPAPGLCPYKGLDYFDEADANLFVGREALTEKLTECVLSFTTRQDAGTQRFFAVIGASGSGKSSLVRAGLVPALRGKKVSANWPIYILTPGAHPLENLALCLTQDARSVVTTAALMDDLGTDPRSLGLYISRALKPTCAVHLLLVIDQFEELFTLCRSEEERSAFINNLLIGASEENGQVVVVITLRADFYAHCAGYLQLREALAQNQEFIGAMNDRELRRAIEEPARRGQWEFEPGLVDLILRDVGHEPGALPLLSHALLETWQRRHGHTLTLSGYTSAGGVRGAIAETAEAVFVDRFTREQQAIARRIFLRLTELGEVTAVGDTRRQATFKELILKPEETAATQAVLQALANARLITTSEDSAQVAHEALIREWPTLRHWLEEDREGLHLHRHLTEAAFEWSTANCEPDLLYRGVRLAQMREWAATHEEDMNEQECEFLAASVALSEQEAAEREAQRQRELEAAKKLAEAERKSALKLRARSRTITVVGVIAVALAVMAGIFAFYSNQNALNADLQRNSALSAQATAQNDAQSRATAEALAVNERETAQNNLINAERSRLAALALNSYYGNQSGEVSALLALRSLLHYGYSPDADGVLSTASGRGLMRFQNYQTDIVLIPFDIASQADVKSFLVAISYSGNLEISEANTGVMGPGFILLGNNTIRFRAALSRDGTQVVTGDMNGVVILRNVAGQEIRSFNGHTEAVNSVAFSPSGNTVASGSSDRTTRIWDAQTGQELLRLVGKEPVLVVKFSPDGKFILTAGADKLVRLWDSQTGAELRQYAGHDDSITDAAFSPDGQWIVSSSKDKTARIWEMATGMNIRILSHNSGIEMAVFSPDGHFILTGGDDGVARLWNAQTGVELKQFVGHTGPVISGTFSPDGKTVATGSKDDTVKIWNVDLELGPRSIAGNLPGDLSDFEISPDGLSVLLGITTPPARLIDLKTGEERLNFASPEYLSGNPTITDVAISPDGKWAATAEITKARLWNMETGQEVRQFVEGDEIIIGLDFSPDSQYIVTAGNSIARLWEVQTGRKIRLFPTTHWARVVAFSPDGKYLATGHYYDYPDTWLWDVSSGWNMQMFCCQDRLQYIRDVAFSPDSRFVISAGDSAAHLWSVETGAEIRRFTIPGAKVYAAVFSHDGKYIATGSDDKTARIWDVATGQEVRRMLTDISIINNVRFSVDDQFLYTSGSDPKSLWRSLTIILQEWRIDLQEQIRLTCAALPRDFTAEERTLFGITDDKPTCPTTKTSP